MSDLLKYNKTIDNYVKECYNINTLQSHHGDGNASQ